MYFMVTVAVKVRDMLGEGSFGDGLALGLERDREDKNR